MRFSDIARRATKRQKKMSLGIGSGLRHQAAPAQTRAEVRRCFDAAGRNGAYILCPSDNFFDAEPELVKAFADEARRCVYPTTA